MSPMARASSGSVSTSPIQNRRVMSTSSGSGPSTAPTVRSSSAMPHFGQFPGPRWRTSGCIGQVYIRSSAVMTSPLPGLRAHAARPAPSGAGTTAYTVEPLTGTRSARKLSATSGRRSSSSAAPPTVTAARRAKCISYDAIISNRGSPMVRHSFSRGGRYFVTDFEKSIDSPTVIAVLRCRQSAKPAPQLIAWNRNFVETGPQSEGDFVRAWRPSRGRAATWSPPLSSLQYDLHDIGDFLVALMLGLGADDPAGLEVGERNGLLDKSRLPWLGRARELDDLRPGFQIHGDLARLAPGGSLQRDRVGVGVDRLDGAGDRSLVCPDHARACEHAQHHHYWGPPHARLRSGSASVHWSAVRVWRPAGTPSEST